MNQVKEDAWFQQKRQGHSCFSESTYPSMKGDFQEPFVTQPAWIFLRKANVQDAHESYKRVLLFAEALAYPVD